MERDARIVRYRAKILSVPQNALMLVDAAREHGYFGAFFSRWPAAD